jgi:hypothetical protein
MLAFSGKEPAPDVTPFGCQPGNTINVGNCMHGEVCVMQH